MLRKLRHHVVIGVTTALLKLFRTLPRNLSLFLGSLLGISLYRLQRKDRFRTQRNLLAANFTSLSPAGAKRIARAAFVNAGVHVADAARLYNHYPDELAKLIDVTGREHFDEMYSRGNGVVAMTGHIGNFELLAAWFGRNGYKTAAIGREVYQSRLNDLLIANRRANNVVNIPTTDPRKFARKLKEGYAIGVLIDNDSWRVRGEFIESYGRMSYTPIGQTLLGMRCGAAFMPLHCVRTQGRYKLTFHPEVIPRDFGDSSQGRRYSAVDLTWRVRQILDQTVAEYPEQWLWVHNRWRTPLLNLQEPVPGLELWLNSQGVR